MALTKETSGTGSTDQNSEITCRPRMTINMEKGKNRFVRGTTSSPDRTVEVLESQPLKNGPVNAPLLVSLEPGGDHSVKKVSQKTCETVEDSSIAFMSSSSASTVVSVTDDGSTKRRKVIESASKVVHFKNVAVGSHDDCCVIESETCDEGDEVRVVKVVQVDSDSGKTTQDSTSSAVVPRKRASVPPKTRTPHVSILPRVYATGRPERPAVTVEDGRSKAGATGSVGMTRFPLDQTESPPITAFSVSLPAAPPIASVACSMFTCFAPPPAHTFQPNVQCVQLNPVPSSGGLGPTTAPNGHLPPIQNYMVPPHYSAPPLAQTAPGPPLTALQPLQTPLPVFQASVPFRGYPPASCGWCQQQWKSADLQPTQGLGLWRQPPAFAVPPPMQSHGAAAQGDSHNASMVVQRLRTEIGADSPSTLPHVGNQPTASVQTDPPSPVTESSATTSNTAAQRASGLTDSLRLLAEGGCSAFARSVDTGRRNSGRSSRGERADSGFHSDGDGRCSSALFRDREEGRTSSSGEKCATANSFPPVSGGQEIIVEKAVTMNRRARARDESKSPVKHSRPNGSRRDRPKSPSKRPSSQSGKSRSKSKSSPKRRKVNSKNTREESKSPRRSGVKSKREPKSAKPRSTKRSSSITTLSSIHDRKSSARFRKRFSVSPDRTKNEKMSGKQQISSKVAKPFVGYILEKVVLERTLADIKKRVREQQRAPVLDHFRGISGKGTGFPQSVEDFILKARECEKVENKQLELKNRLAALLVEKASIIAKYPSLVIRRSIDDLVSQNESLQKMNAILNELTTTFFTLGDVSQYEPAVLERVKQKLLRKIPGKQADVRKAKVECAARKEDIFDVLFRILQLPEKAERSEENLRRWVEMVCNEFNHELQEKNVYETKCLKSLKYSREIDNLLAKLKHCK